MTVSTTPSRVSYSGNGTTTAFSFPYPFVAGDLAVVLTDEDDGSEVTQTISTHYTVSGTGLSNGVYASGTVTFVTAPGSDKQVIIYRAPPLTQETDLTAETSDELAINKRFDIIEMKLQRLDNARSRSLRASEGFYSTFDWTLPDVDGVNATAGQAIVLKNGVAGLQWGSPSSATVSAAMASFVNSASLQAARSTLGVAEALAPEGFGAVGDGVTDDLTALTAWLNAVMASNHRAGVMPAKTYAISGALPNITASHVRIIGAGPSTSHDVGAAGGTIIKAITNTGFAMLTVAPTEGASAQRLDSIVIDGVTFDGNSRATKGLVVKSLLRGTINVTVLECTTSGLEFDVATTLGESRDTQRCAVRFTGRQLTNAAPALRLKGDSGANTSFMLFDYVDIIHKNEVGIISENADNNSWGDVRIIKAAGGSATYSWEMRGGATGAQAVRAEMIYQLSTTVAVIAKGTGTYTVGAGYKGANDPAPIQVHYLDVANGTPLPVVEAGASLHVHSSKGTDAPSASTTDLARYSADFTDITGTTGITSFGYAPSGSIRHVRFTGALTLTHNGTSFILPGSANITTAANDTATFVSLGSGNWLCASYKRADGQPIGAVAHTQITANPTPGTGSYTTASGTLRYNVVNGRVSFTWNGSITTVGTGATDLRFTLPFAAETYTPFVGIRTSTGTPLVASAAAASSTVICTLAGGADPNGNYFFSVAGSYEADV